MDQRDVLLALVSDLLAATLDQSGWDAFLLRLCDALDGTGIGILSHSFPVSPNTFSVTARTDPEAVARYHQHWHRFDPWASSPVTRSLGSGDVVTGDQLIARADLKRTVYHNEFGVRFGIGQSLAGMIEVAPRSLTCITVNRDERTRRFDAQDVLLLKTLMPHLQRSMKIRRRLALSDLTVVHLTEVLHRSPHGVFLLSINGGIVFRNQAADALIREADGLTVEGGELRGSTSGSTAALRQALQQALQTSKGTDIGSGNGLLVVPRPSGRRPLTIVVTPLPPGSIESTEISAAAALFVTDPDKKPHFPIEAIKGLFHLTAGESELVRCLAEGLTLDQAATHLRLAHETVRSRLKVVFMKTDTHRQSELIMLVRTALAAV